MSRFYGKTIWITGASSGIGKDLALALQEAEKVYISARSKDALQKIADTYDNFEAIPLDCADKTAVKKAAEKLDKLDILILNAGICEYVDLDSFDSATFERTYQINVMGTLYMFEACLPLLKKSSDAQLVINSSSVAWLPITRAEAYGSSKAALNYIFTAIEPQLKPHGIAVSIICPGFVKTPLTDKNDFPMPCLIDSEKAAAIIRKGIAKKKRIIHFPKRFTWTLRLIGCLPVSIQSWLMRKAVVKREA